MTDDDLRKLLDGVRDGDPTRHQLDPEEPDPVSGETADDAEERLHRTGLVNPFHAVELQRRQNARREKSDSLIEILEAWDGEGNPFEEDER